MRVVSTFSGIGGIDLGLERAGHTIVTQVESDPYRRALLALRFPGVPVFDDVRTFPPADDGPAQLGDGGGQPDGDGPSRELAAAGVPQGDGSSRPGRLRDVGGDGARRDAVSERGRGRPWQGADLICGGFPCQDVSVAGQRAGLAGARSGLFFEFARIADAVLGAGGWVLIENVPGLLSSHGGRDFGVVLATLADLGFHDLAWRVLDSRYFGVPQRRRRLFVLARRARGRRSFEVLLEPESGGGDFAPRGQASSSPSPDLGDSPSGGFDADPDDLPDLRGPGSDGDDDAGDMRQLRWDGPDEAAPLTAGGRRPGISPAGRRLEDDWNIVAGEYVPDRVDAVTAKWRKGTGGPAGDEAQNLIAPQLAGTLGMGQDGGMRTTDLDGSGAYVIDPDRAAPDPDGVRAASGLPGRMDGAVGLRTAQRGANGIGIAEGEAHTLDGTGGAAVASAGVIAGDRASFDPRPDGQRYAACGDAVTVPVAEWIGQRLAQLAE